MKTQLLLGGAAALLLGAAPGLAGPATASPVPVVATDGAQAGWTAWYGCWRAVTQSDGALVCVLPGADAQSVRLTTIENGTVLDETVLRADGVTREVDEGGCTGVETARFSADGRRVFTRAELECDGVQRVSTGVLALIAEDEWVDAQALTVGSQSAARSVRYRAVPRSELPSAAAAVLPSDARLAQEAARLDAAAPLDIAAVTEAAGILAPAALEAWLGARQQGFGIDGRTLVQLESAGVAPSTIDVMVALSHPTRFAVQERVPSGYAGEYSGDQARGLGGYDMDYCDDPRMSTRRYRANCLGMGYDRYGYDRYGYGNTYGYSPWGYDPYGWNYGRGPVVIVQPQAPEGGTVVKGEGYRRGEAPVRGRAAPRAEPRRGAPASSGSAAPASTRSTEPASSRSGTGRTAKPRPSGGQGGEGGQGGQGG